MSLKLPNDKPAQVSEISRIQQRKMFSGASEAFGVVVKYAVYFIALSYGILFLVRILHLILPECILWLNDDQIQSINTFLFSGVSGALVGNYLKNIIHIDKT